MTKLKSGVYRFPSRQCVLPMRSECDTADTLKMLTTGGEGSVMDNEHHQHNYKSKWDKATRCLSKIVDEPQAETIEDVEAQLAHVFEYGDSRQAAKAVIATAKAVWAHCEMHEHEHED